MDIGKFRYSCKYPSCKSKYYSPITNIDYKNKHFFIFPKDQDLLKNWKTICKIDSFVNCTHFYLCEDHFNNSDFKNETRSRLNYRVIPKTSEAITATKEILTHKEIGQPFSNSNLENIEISTNSLPCCDEEHSTSSTDLENHLDFNSTDLPSDPSNFDFLLEKKGILGSIGLAKKDLSPRKSLMYQTYRNAMSKLSKLKNVLAKEKDQLKVLTDLYEDGKFEFINENFNDVTYKGVFKFRITKL